MFCWAELMQKIVNKVFLIKILCVPKARALSFKALVSLLCALNMLVLARRNLYILFTRMCAIYYSLRLVKPIARSRTARHVFSKLFHQADMRLLEEPY